MRGNSQPVFANQQGECFYAWIKVIELHFLNGEMKCFTPKRFLCAIKYSH
jgi:hypothetical protein